MPADNPLYGYSVSIWLCRFPAGCSSVSLPVLSDWTLAPTVAGFCLSQVHGGCLLHMPLPDTPSIFNPYKSTSQAAADICAGPVWRCPHLVAFPVCALYTVRIDLQSDTPHVQQSPQSSAG